MCLDLYCKAGGCTRGYQQAGFYVVGVDIERQKNYIGDDFLQADALAIPPKYTEWLGRQMLELIREPAR
jgi:DNA (cytosine-5)-methyltransferase 1